MAKKLRLTGRASFSSPLTFGVGLLRNQVILVDDATGAKLQALVNRESDPDVPVFTLLTGAEAVNFDLTKGAPASPQPDGSVVIDPSRVARLPYRIPKGVQLRGVDLVPYGWSNGAGGYTPNAQALVSEAGKPFDTLTAPLQQVTITGAISTTVALTATATGTYRKARIAWNNNGASGTAKLRIAANTDNDVHGLVAGQSAKRRDYELTMGDAVTLVCAEPITRLTFSADGSITSGTHSIQVTFGS